MARSENNVLLHGFSGKVGNVLIKRYGTKTVLSAIPDMGDRVLSEKQKDYNELMRFANVYAKHITSNPVLKEEACKKLMVPPNKVFRALVKEFILRKADVDELIKLPNNNPLTASGK